MPHTPPPPPDTPAGKLPGRPKLPKVLVVGLATSPPVQEYLEQGPANPHAPRPRKSHPYAQTRQANNQRLRPHRAIVGHWSKHHPPPPLNCPPPQDVYHAPELTNVAPALYLWFATAFYAPYARAADHPLYSTQG